jgi:hypothetical protein
LLLRQRLRLFVRNVCGKGKERRTDCRRWHRSVGRAPSAASAARHWLQCWRPQLPTARSRPVDWPELPRTVFPFILRNVSLLGINSVKAPNLSPCVEAWRRLASESLSKVKELSEKSWQGARERVRKDFGCPWERNHQISEISADSPSKHLCHCIGVV